METIYAWLFALMLSTAPNAQARADYAKWTGVSETEEARIARYKDIVDDVVEVSFDPDTKPLFWGERGRIHTAALLLAVAHHESKYAKDIDQGPCRGPRSRCDHGASACMMQIHIGKWKTREGWTKKDLFEDRQKCFRAGLELLRSSLSQCRGNTQETKLAAYASGKCDSGHQGARELWQTYRLFRRGAPLDSDFASAVAAKE